MFPAPAEGSVFYSDSMLYACLAYEPIVEGHVLVIMKKGYTDLNKLPEDVYIHVMKVIYNIRKVMLYIYNTDKVYMCYLDEARHVHFHLFPRKPGGQDGFEMMHTADKRITEFTKAPLLSQALLF